MPRPSRLGSRTWRRLAVGMIMVAASIPTVALGSVGPFGETKLFPVAGASNVNFGYSVAMYGDTALVGAPWGGPGTTNAPGTAYVFRHDGASWLLEATLQASDPIAFPPNRFGYDVALEGDTAVVAAPGDQDNTGAVYVFSRTGTTWTESSKLIAPGSAPSDFVGQSIDISGGTIVVGNPRHDQPVLNAGAAFVWSRTGSTWTFEAKLTALDAGAGDGFGIDVAIDSSTIAVGAWQDDDQGADAGAVLVFTNGTGTWIEQQKLTGSAMANSGLGYSLDISGDTILAGLNGSAMNSQLGTVLVFDRSGASWSETAAITQSDGVIQDAFGSSSLGSIALEGDTAIIGAKLHPQDSTVLGAAYVVTRQTGGGWTETAKLIASDGQFGDEFGFSVALSGDTFLVGAARAAGTGASSGAAYLYAPAAAPNRDPMLGIDAAPVVVDEGTRAVASGSVSDPDGDTVSLTASLGHVANKSDGTWSWTFDTDDGPTESQSVTISGDDGNGGGAALVFELTVNNVAPTITALTGPLAPVDIANQSAVAIEVAFTDPSGGDTHDLTWDWGDGSPVDTQVGVTSPALQGHTYAEPGVYSVEVTVADDDGGSDSDTYEFVVIYDPDGGFVTGGGWIDSPTGAYVPDPTLTGKANFGFVSKYKKGASVPQGSTEFQFKAGDLNFHSSSYDWLVIAGQDKAKYKGTGTINGSGHYGFMLTAVDHGNTGDTFRIKIWDKDENDALVYDNKIGASDDGYEGASIAGGNIKVHKN